MSKKYLQYKYKENYKFFGNEDIPANTGGMEWHFREGGSSIFYICIHKLAQFCGSESHADPLEKTGSELEIYCLYFYLTIIIDKTA